MKSHTLITLLFLCITLQFATAQTEKFKPMKYPYFEASASIGLLPTFVKDIASTEVLPLGFSLDYRMNRRFSVGLFSGYTKARSHSKMLKDENSMTLITEFSMIGGRFAGHFSNYERWDLYGGLGINYTHSNIEVIEGDLDKLIKHKNFKPSRGAFMMSAFVGAKYAINPSTSVFAEVGYGISLLNVGMSKRFKKI